MKYRRLGNTDLMVSEISFGCGSSAGLMVNGTPEERINVVSKALELGVNLFDTSPAYGNGLSETHLGETIRKLGVKPLIATKIALRSDDFDQLSKSVMDSVEDSLMRLGVDHIDLIQLHNRVTQVRLSMGEKVGFGPLLTTNEVLGTNGVVDALETLRQQGKVKYFGFTTFGGDLSAINQLMDSGRFHAINSVYNLLNPSAGRNVSSGLTDENYGQVIQRASRQGMGVLVIRVLAAGSLTGQSMMSSASRHSEQKLKEFERNKQRIEKLKYLMQLEDSNLPQIANRFALTNDAVSTVVGGFSIKEHLEDAVSGSEQGVLSEKSIEYLERLYEENFDGV
jgi:aryl-alcohol dehydrogenase-like predicted oxidoreductase